MTVERFATQFWPGRSVVTESSGSRSRRRNGRSTVFVASVAEVQSSVESTLLS